MIIELDPIRVLVLSIVVLWVGELITQKVGALQRFSIPIAVTGGVLCSLVVALLDVFAEVRVSFDLEIRDTLLLLFFSTIGLSAKLGTLKEGGRTLAILGAVTFAFLLAQNAVGIAMATASGQHWAYGLIGGSISLAGGHGTAITWGALGEEAGLVGATSLGLAFATFGLICGGVVGGPIANRLIRRHGLTGPDPEKEDAEKGATASGDPSFSVTSSQTIRTIFLLAICLGIGEELNDLLRERGTVLPGFLTAMLVGIVLTNLADSRKKPVDTGVVDLLGSVCLHLFLAMSLMSMQLTQLAGAFGGVALILVAQVALAVIFATQIVFRVCGRDYDAAIIAAGYAGLGLGATPVGVANMNAVTSRFGPSPKAFLVIPLVGAFLLDIVNAFVIQTYIGLLG
ncbi:MAG: sodium/glutamate symporter [Deltaproteobacteria bacterium]|nr:sodium/glutamate symporter [Deltaproteobacteria bacterium]MBW2394654.1 sodium/glutamate symporter [Deltaproteobacteria bacterium]